MDHIVYYNDIQKKVRSSYYYYFFLKHYCSCVFNIYNYKIIIVTDFYMIVLIVDNV